MSAADTRSQVMAIVGNVRRAWEREVAFEWEIENFSKIPDSVDYSCSSPDFDFCGRTWYLQLFPNGEVFLRSHGYVGLYLMGGGRRAPLEVRYSLGIRSAKGETEMAVTDTDTFDAESVRFCGSGKMVRRSDLLRRRERLLPRDVLTIRAILRANLPVEGTKDVSIQTKVEDIAAEDEKDEKAEKTGTERVLQDIGKMFPSDEHCDVVLGVGDVKFKAHRAILAARTPVLGAMFRHDTAEKASGEVTIEDCEPAVFEQLLHYIYKGAPRELTAENACSLYVVADKYLVSEVKALCLRCMRDTLCVDTFCDAVALSLLHGEDELLETAVYFFSRNMLHILQTVQWQIFNRDHSTWANEIMIRAVKIENERRPDGDSLRA